VTAASAIAHLIDRSPVDTAAMEAHPPAMSTPTPDSIDGARSAQDERLFTPAFVGLALAELAYFTAQGLLIPTTPLFAAGPLGADEIGVGLAVGVFSVTALLLRPFAGRESDRRGRRPLLIGGALLAAAAIAAHLLVPDLIALAGVRLVLGVAEAFFFVASFAALADLAPPGRTGEAVSFNSLALYLGVAFGPLLGEVLIDSGGFTLAWAGGAALALAAALVASRLPETAKRLGDPGAGTALVSRPAIPPALALFTGVAGMAGFFAFVALYARDLGLEGSRLVLLEFGLIVVGCRVVFARLPDRVPPFRLGAVALALIATGLATAAAVPSAAGLFLAAAILAAGVAFVTPAMFAAIFACVPAQERGAAAGTAGVFLDLAFGGGPMALGLVAGVAGIPAGFAAAAVLAGFGAIGAAVAAARARSGVARAQEAT
jgi:MFS family permease